MRKFIGVISKDNEVEVRVFEGGLTIFDFEESHLEFDKDRADRFMENCAEAFKEAMLAREYLQTNNPQTGEKDEERKCCD